MQSVTEHVPGVQSSIERPRLTSQSQSCPHCEKGLIAQEIPKEYRECHLGFEPDGLDEHGLQKYKPKPDDGRFMFYSHIIGMSSILHDRILAYKCPFCENVDVIHGLEHLWATHIRYENEREAKVIKTGRYSSNMLSFPGRPA